MDGDEKNKLVEAMDDLAAAIRVATGLFSGARVVAIPEGATVIKFKDGVPVNVEFTETEGSKRLGTGICSTCGIRKQMAGMTSILGCTVYEVEDRLQKLQSCFRFHTG